MIRKFISWLEAEDVNSELGANIIISAGRKILIIWTTISIIVFINYIVEHL